MNSLYEYSYLQLINLNSINSRFQGAGAKYLYKKNIQFSQRSCQKNVFCATDAELKISQNHTQNFISLT